MVSPTLELLTRQGRKLDLIADALHEVIGREQPNPRPSGNVRRDMIARARMRREERTG